MTDKFSPKDDAHHLLDRLTDLNKNAPPQEPWRVEQEPHEYPDGTTHFTHVVTTGYIQDEAVKVAIATHLSPTLAELLVTIRNNLPQLIQLAREGLKD